MKNLRRPEEEFGCIGSSHGGARRYLSREAIRQRLDALEAANPEYFAWARRRYGKPKTK